MDMVCLWGFKKLTALVRPWPSLPIAHSIYISPVNGKLASLWRERKNSLTLSLVWQQDLLFAAWFSAYVVLLFSLLLSLLFFLSFASSRHSRNIGFNGGN